MAVAVRYRGHTFYIADDDLDTKATFVFLTQLYALQAQKAQGPAPIVTVPATGD